MSKQRQDIRQDLLGPRKMHSSSYTSLEGKDEADSNDIAADSSQHSNGDSDPNQVGTDTPEVLFIDTNSPEVDCPPEENCPPILDEVEDFFSLLNSTLHQPEVDTSIACVCSETSPPELPEGGKEDILLPSGRLAERIRSLKLYVSTYNNYRWHLL